MTVQQVNRQLKRLPGWHYVSKKKAIQATFKVKDFSAAVRAIQKIARLAEKLDHHPDIYLTRYRRLTFVLTTHSAGAVTSRDLLLARKIQRLLPQNDN